MTQKLKISVRETVKEQKELTCEQAADIIYCDYVGNNCDYWCNAIGYVRGSIRKLDNIWKHEDEKWYCEVKHEIVRLATTEEIHAYHSREIKKLKMSKDDVGFDYVLGNNDILVEVVGGDLSPEQEALRQLEIRHIRCEECKKGIWAPPEDYNVYGMIRCGLLPGSPYGRTIPDEKCPCRNKEVEK